MELSGKLHAPVALPPVPTGEKAGWASEPVWTQWQNGEKKNPCPHQESKPGKKKERKNEINEGGWTRGRRKREDKVRARREEKENEMQAVNKRKRMETITWKSPGLDGNQDLLCASCKDRSPLADATRCCSCSKTKESAWPCCGEVWSRHKMAQEAYLITRDAANLWRHHQTAQNFAITVCSYRYVHYRLRHTMKVYRGRGQPLLY
jgi:hypothetical protein